MARLVQIKQPLLMRVRRPGEMLANPVIKFDAPFRMVGTYFIEQDPNNAIVAGWRHGATDVQEPFGGMNGQPRKIVSRLTANTNDNCILECFPANQARFGAEVDMLLGGSQSLILPWREDVERYEATRSVGSWIIANIGNTVSIIFGN